jgi:hypothetical protein
MGTVASYHRPVIVTFVAVVVTVIAGILALSRSSLSFSLFWETTVGGEPLKPLTRASRFRGTRAVTSEPLSGTKRLFSNCRRTWRPSGTMSSSAARPWNPCPPLGGRRCTAGPRWRQQRWRRQRRQRRPSRRRQRRRRRRQQQQQQHRQHPPQSRPRTGQAGGSLALSMQLNLFFTLNARETLK